MNFLQRFPEIWLPARQKFLRIQMTIIFIILLTLFAIFLSILSFCRQVLDSNLFMTFAAFC